MSLKGKTFFYHNYNCVMFNRQFSTEVSVKKKRLISL